MFRLKLLYLILIFINLNFVSAIRINEVEINPLEGKDGIEWIELYNDGENDLDISGWEVWEGVYGLSGSRKIQSIQNNTIVQAKVCYIIEWSSPKLNNGGDFVILYDSNGTKIDETEMLDEPESGIKTWQFCDSWEFKDQTKGEENSCEEVPEEPIEEAEEVNEKYQEMEELQETEKPVSRETEPIELQTINLNPQVIKSEDDNENLSKSNYAIYGLVFFCVLLVVLFILRKNKYNKNEFR